MTDIKVIREAIEGAAQAITELGPTFWPEWAVYLLETLDSEAQARGADAAAIRSFMQIGDPIHG